MSGSARDTEAFDSYARTFDEGVGSSPVVQALRRRIYGIVREVLPGGGRVLDINCGTGTDCLALTGMGYRAVGVDLSPAMISRARSKATPGVDVRFDVVPFDRMGVLERGAYDLVLSNNSGLNCAPDLRELMNVVRERLRVGGWFIGVVMPPFSLWEFAAGMSRLDLRYALRRRFDRTANIGGERIDVRYYGEPDVRAAARGKFDVWRVIGFNVVSPPPNAHAFVAGWPRLSRWLEGIDAECGRIPPLRRWGDQICFVLRSR